MHIFYDPDFNQDNPFLNREESHHCVKVLRMKKGDFLYVSNGKGVLFEAELINPDQKKCILKVLKINKDHGKRAFSLHIAIAPTKNINRFEWFLEKSTECGIDTITPLLCEKSERRVIKTERLEKQMIAAMKQSCRAYLPVLNPLISFSDFLIKHKNNKGFIAHCYEGKKTPLYDICKKYDDILIMIGPEGDFTKKEIDLAESYGFRAISMGDNRLRTETAGVVACIQANTVKGLL